MATNTDYVTTAKPRVAGVLYVAPYGTAIPTDATTDLSSAFVSLGGLSEDGIENSDEINMNDYKDFAGDVVLSSLDEHTDTRTYGLIEYKNENVLKAIYGEDNVTVDSSNDTISIASTSDEPEPMVWVEEVILADNTLKRTVIPKGIITERDTISFKRDELVKFDITVTCHAVDGVTHYDYLSTVSE